MGRETIRNSCLDCVKGIACICVIFMHCEFPGLLGTFVQCVSRFCVPFFFMVSGYYCYRSGGTVNYGKKIKHIAVITLCASLFYGLIAIIPGGVISVHPSGLVKWLLFNQPVIIAGQMWFLFALLYDYILFALVDRLGLKKLAFAAIPAGILAYIALAQGAHLLGKSVPNMIYRNFLIEGFPMFSLGCWVHENEERIQVSNRTLNIGIIVFTILCPVERLLMGRDFGVNIVSFPQVICIFLYCIKNPEKGKDSWLAVLGLKYSLYMYVFHPAVWHGLEKLYSVARISDNLFAQYLMPVLCVILTLLVSITFTAISGKWKSTLKKD